MFGREPRVNYLAYTTSKAKVSYGFGRQHEFVESTVVREEGSKATMEVADVQGQQGMREVGRYL